MKTPPKERPYNPELATIMLNEGDFEGLANEVAKPPKLAQEWTNIEVAQWLSKSKPELVAALAAERARSKGLEVGWNACCDQLAAEREKCQPLVDALKKLRGWTRYVRLPCGQYSLAHLEKAEAQADAALEKAKAP